MDTALRLLLLLSLGGTAMGLVLMLMRRVLGKRLPSALYYYAWLLVLVRLILPLPGLVPLEETDTAPSQVYAGEAAAWRASDRTWLSGGESEDSPVTDVDRAESGTEEISVSTAVSQTADTALETGDSEELPVEAGNLWARAWAVLSRPGFWLVVWVAGAVVYAAGCVGGYVRFMHVLKKTFRPAYPSDMQVYDRVYDGKKPTLVRSRYVKSPMLMGLWKPLLVLPNRVYAPSMLENVLRHELTHYHRGDIAYKWFAMAVFSLHWFNPFAGLFRREMDRLCELSCDEYILREMTEEEKRDYGETLLSLAAIRPLPKSVVATTFATEKRTLKERLEQIMTYKHRGKAGLALALAAILLLGGCGAVMGPEAADTEKNAIQAQTLSARPTPDPIPVMGDRGDGITVSTVDEFLAAIAPGNTIYLEPGEYILSQAENYGQNNQGGWYTWEYVGNGYQLSIYDVEGLTILGGGEATICTEPRGVEVIAFYGCSGVNVCGTVVGHTEYPATCSGGVLYFESTDEVSVSDCVLYGCGTWGITAVNCRGVTALNTVIYDCSYGAIQAENSYDIQFVDGWVYDCSEYGMELFCFAGCYGAAVVNSEVYGNGGDFVLRALYSDEVYLLGTRVTDNDISLALLYAYPYNVVAEGCSFENNGTTVFVGQRDLDDTSVAAVSLAGEELDEADLAAMTLAEQSYEGPAPVAATAVEKTVLDDGITEVWVTNADEFLAAIGPDTIIHMAAGTYDLSTAQYYGAYGSQYYYWTSSRYSDGPGLVISGVDNLTILGEGKDAVEFLAAPRYVEVITFNACTNVTLAGITAGHSPINESTCIGGVVKLENCDGVLIRECGLFGCGTYGVSTYKAENVQVLETEIYDCSVGAAWIRSSEDIAFENCDIHDCANNNAFDIYESENVTRDGMTLR